MPQEPTRPEHNDARKLPRDMRGDLKDNAGGLLEEIKSKGMPRALEEKERLGQFALVNSDTLPTEMSEIEKSALEKAGVKFPEEQQKGMFQKVKLPSGWKKVLDQYSQFHSYLIDAEGRERATISHKASPYESYARMSVNSRLNVGTDYKENKIVGIVRDADFYEDGVRMPGTILYETPAVPKDDEDVAMTRANVWIKKYYPNFRDLNAYWNEEIKADKNKEIEWPIVKSFPVVVDYDMEHYVLNTVARASGLNPNQKLHRTHREGSSNIYHDDLYRIFGKTRKRIVEEYSKWSMENSTKIKKIKPKNIEVHLIRGDAFRAPNHDEYAHENGTMYKDHVLESLVNQGLRPATCEELLAFQEQYPDYPNDDFKEILASGSSFADKDDELTKQTLHLYYSSDNNAGKGKTENRSVHLDTSIPRIFSDDKKREEWFIAAVKDIKTDSQEAESTPETKTEIKRFSKEAREALEKEGYLIYSLPQRQTIKTMIENGYGILKAGIDSANWYKKYPNLENQLAVQSEMAINPNKLYLLPRGDEQIYPAETLFSIQKKNPFDIVAVGVFSEKSFLVSPGNNLMAKMDSFEQIEELVSKFSEVLGEKIPGVKAAIGEATDYLTLYFEHFNKTLGEPLFPILDSEWGTGTLTKTFIKEWASSDNKTLKEYAVVGYYQNPDNLPFLSSESLPNKGTLGLHIAPLVIPT